MDTITETELTQALEMNRRYAISLGGSLCSDLESAGREAIVRAMQTYSRERGTFCTYARAFIKKFQILERKNLLTAVTLPVNDYSAAVCVEVSALQGYPTPQHVEPDFTSLHLALAELPSEQRGVVLAYYVEEKPLREIAAPLGLTIEGTRQRLKKAEWQLRRILVKD